MTRPLDAFGRPIVEDRKPYDTAFFNAVNELCAELVKSKEGFMLTSCLQATKVALNDTTTPFFPRVLRKGDTFDVATEAVRILGPQNVLRWLHKQKLTTINYKV